MRAKEICPSCVDFDPSSFESGSFTIIESPAKKVPGSPGLVCLDCKACVAIKTGLNGLSRGISGVNPHPAWRTLKDLLDTRDSDKNGWIKAEGAFFKTFFSSVLGHLQVFASVFQARNAF